MDVEAFPQTTLAILAGGEGSRMGKPKALLEVEGQPVLQYLLEQFAWPGPKWLITSPGREHPPGCDAFDRELVDPEPGAGPLRGILTALQELRTPALVVAPVDMPMLGAEQLSELVRCLATNTAALGLMFTRVIQGEARVEPFPIALRNESAPRIQHRLQGMQRSVHRLLDDPSFVAVPAPADWPDEVWTNLNEPGEFEDFLRKHVKR